MVYELLKGLFFELFDVSHLMSDLIDEVEDTYNGDETMTSFFTEKIKSECSRKHIIEHIEEYSASCLGSLTDEELEEFLNELF